LDTTGHCVPDSLATLASVVVGVEIRGGDYGTNVLMVVWTRNNLNDKT
jgi:hypothetical protein